MYKVFIDGREGTTGLRIYERLAPREDIELIILTDGQRKDAEFRREALNSADVAFLCLPDDAAREAVAMTKNPNTRIIDASTAHRTLPEWCYGFPELSGEFRKRLATSKRTVVPGCHASGFTALVYPLIEAGILSPAVALTCHSVTGYSGGGKKMIAEYEDGSRSPLLSAPRQYAITQSHKHLPEMQKISGLEKAPVFCPIVADFYSGMCVTIQLFSSDLNGAGVRDIREVYAAKYTGPVVSYRDAIDEGGFISANALSGLDSMEITVSGNDERILLISRFCNLGKGASGAAVQCMNIMLGLDPVTGLEL